jgi:hypothetical protein
LLFVIVSGRNYAGSFDREHPIPLILRPANPSIKPLGGKMEKQLIIVSIIIFLVCVGLNRCLGIGFLIFDGIIWFTAKNMYEATRKTT